MWKDTNLQITVIGLLVDETYKTMKSSEPEKFKQVVDQFSDIVTDVDTTIVKNEQGDLAIRCAGHYYPIQSGSWIQKECWTDDDAPEDVRYNALVPFGDLNHLLMLEAFVKVGPDRDTLAKMIRDAWDDFKQERKNKKKE